MAKENTTATDIAPAKLADEAAAASFKLDPHLINLMWSEPFFSKILRRVTKKKTDSIPTAGVLAKDGQLMMWWNPRFLAGLTSAQVKGLLKHECYHLVFEHTTTRKHDPHIIWNYATDLAINSDIPEEQLPEGGLIPGKAFKELTEDDKAKMGPEAVGRYERVSAKIASFPKGESSEWYFTKLMEDPEIAEDIQEAAKGDGEAGPGMPGAMDDHEGWGEMSDEEKELLKGKIRKAVEDAVKDCDSSGRWGSVGAEMRKTLRELISKEVDWRSVLRKFCGLSRRADRRGTGCLPTRRYHP